MTTKTIIMVIIIIVINNIFSISIKATKQPQVQLKVHSLTLIYLICEAPKQQLKKSSRLLTP